MHAGRPIFQPLLSADGVIATDLKGRVTGLNPAAEHLSGWTSAQALGRPLGDVFKCIDQRTREPVAIEMHEVLLQGKSLAMAAGSILLCRDGLERRISGNASPLRAAGGLIAGMVLVISDASTAYRMQEELAHDLALLHQIGEIARVGGWQLDVASMQITWSDELRHIFGAKTADAWFCGRGFDFVAPADRPVAQAALQEAIERGTSWSFNALATDAEGVERWLHCQGVAQSDGGRVVRLTGVLQDITERKLLAEHVVSSEMRYRELFEASPLPTWVFDAKTSRFLMVNQAAVRHYGYSESEFLSMAAKDIRPEQDIPRLLTLLEDPSDRGFQSPATWRHIKKDGSLIEVEISDHKLEFFGQAARLVQAQDVTERNRALRAIEEQRQRMLAIVETGMDSIIAVDADERIVIFNKAAQRTFDCAPSQALGQALDRFIPARHREFHHEHMREFGARQESTRVMQTVALRWNGEEFPIEASLSRSSVAGEDLYIVVLRDISDRVRAARTLMEQRLELSALTRRLMDSEEQTNRVLAQALHDQLGQTLTALRLTFDALQGALPRTTDAATERWRAHMSELIDRSVAQVRHVLVDLRPTLLEEMGLAAALENEFGNHAFVATELLIVFEPDARILTHRWPAKVEYAAFMIAREAVANAVRHARASRIDVSLRHGSPNLQLTIHDDGLGLAADRRSTKASGHLGLVGMRERAVAIGAHLQLASAPGEGTTITLHWNPE